MRRPPDAPPGAPLDLVVQAPVIAPEDVDTLVLLTGAQGTDVPQRAGNDAVRLLEVTSTDGLDPAAAAAGYDVGLVPHDRLLERVRLVAFDMDSTLIAIECIDEIADLHGIKPQVAAITASAMRGEIDFPESLRRRVALLEGLPEAALGQVYDERLVLTHGAERMLAGFADVGARFLLVSGGFTFFTERLRERLGLHYTASNELEVANGVLTGRILGPIVDAAAKAEALRVRAQALRGTDGLVVALGDGANDVPMLRAADVSIAFRAKPVVRAAATHAIDHCGLDAALNLFG
ncbi:MAG TPA: phosphoserine phosphatase SerB [Casimicrobiaceae bacterium]|nr:phosphoserine phosphatase SerB [Casimicrobiaceae bacterium]